jgi:hypothetical protein
MPPMPSQWLKRVPRWSHWLQRVPSPQIGDHPSGGGEYLPPPLGRGDLNHTGVPRS